MIYRSPRLQLLRNYSGYFGTGFKVAAGIQSAYAAKKAGDYNAKIADQESRAALVEAQYRADRIKDRTRRIVHQQIAAVGASGITMEGSPTYVQRDSVIEGMMDELAVLRSGEAVSRAKRFQSDIYRAGGRAAFIGGLLSTASAAFSGQQNSGGSGMDWGLDDASSSSMRSAESTAASSARVSSRPSYRSNPSLRR